MSKLHSGPVAQLGCMVFSFGYSLFIWVWYGLFIRAWSFHLGMVFSFGHGLFICIWSFHSGMVFLFGHGLFIWVWSFHSGMVFSFGHGLFIRAWFFHLGMVFSFGHSLFIRAWSFHGPPEPLNKGHLGTQAAVPYSEVVPYWEVRDKTVILCTFTASMMYKTHYGVIK